MKKSALLLLLIVCSGYTLCFAQLSNHKQNELFIFGKTMLFMTNDYIQHPGKNKSYQNSAGAAHNLYYTVTGPQLLISTFQADSLDVWHGNFSFIGGTLQETSNYPKTATLLNNLQVQVSYNGAVLNSWRDVLACPSVKDTGIYQNGEKGNFKSIYHLLDINLSINESTTVELRQKISGAVLLTLHIKRTGILFQPFLASITHDSSITKSPDVFIQRELADWMYKTGSINSYYQNRPGNGIDIVNQKYHPSSKLAFYFRRPDNYPDSSLEYKLTGGIYDDTNWHASGHLILVPRMQPNASYKLIVRYKNSANLSTYTFYVPPTWYQKYFYLLVYIPGFLIIFFTTILIARYRLRRVNARKEKLAVELKSIRSQLNPHFVFNALSSIQSLINKNEIDLANQYLTEFSSLLRDTLQNHNSEMVPLATDIKILENYVRLEQLRFNFQYEIKTGDYLDLSAIEIPCLLLQPLAENAVKHGIAPLRETGRLSISFNREGNDLVIGIADNGNGFDTTITHDDRHGLRLTKERIALLNKTLKGQSATMNIQSNDKGTIVTLTFKNWLQA